MQTFTFFGGNVFEKWMNKQRYSEMLSVGLEIEPHLLWLVMLLPLSQLCLASFFRLFVHQTFSSLLLLISPFDFMTEPYSMLTLIRYLFSWLFLCVCVSVLLCRNNATTKANNNKAFCIHSHCMASFIRINI